MATVGAFEAKTHFSALLERAAQGEEIVITRFGRPVARLVPAVVTEEGQVDQAIAALKSFRQGRRSMVFPGRSCATQAVGERLRARYFDRGRLVFRGRG